MCVCVFNCVWLFATPWTVACQSPLSMEFFRQEYWSGLPCLPPGDLPDPWIEPMCLVSPALAGEFFAATTTWEGPWLTDFPFSLYELSWLGHESIRRLPAFLIKVTFHSIDTCLLIIDFWVASSWTWVQSQINLLAKSYWMPALWVGIYFISFSPLKLYTTSQNIWNTPKMRAKRKFIRHWVIFCYSQ